MDSELIKAAKEAKRCIEETMAGYTSKLNAALQYLDVTIHLISRHESAVANREDELVIKDLIREKLPSFSAGIFNPDDISNAKYAAAITDEIYNTLCAAGFPITKKEQNNG